MRILEVTGYVVANAERKISKNGKEYLTFRIGNSEFNDKDEQGNSKTFWINVFTFNQRLFGMTQYLTKGKSVIVCGDYNDRIYQNKEGNCDISREIMANGIYFNSNGSDNSNTNGTTASVTNKTVQQSSPVTQTTMTSKPATSDVKVPEATMVNNVTDDSEDDLPF